MGQGAGAISSDAYFGREQRQSSGAGGPANLDMSASDLVSKIGLTARQDMDSIKQASKGHAALAVKLVRALCRRLPLLQCCRLAACMQNALAVFSSIDMPPAACPIGKVLRMSYKHLGTCCSHSQIASQAGSKLSRMAQSFMRDLQVGRNETDDLFVWVAGGLRCDGSAQY